MPAGGYIWHIHHQLYMYRLVGELWAYNTREIIGRGRSQRQLSQGCYMFEARLYVFYTMVTQKYAIKSHLTSLLSSRNHSTIQLAFTVKKNCENTVR